MQDEHVVYLIKLVRELRLQKCSSKMQFLYLYWNQLKNKVFVGLEI